MRRAGPTALLFASLVAVSVALAGVASTFALAHRGTQDLRTDLASVIRADYSADPTGTTLAPLQGEILESARQDEDRLDGTVDGIEIVQVFNPGGAPPGDVEIPGARPTAGAPPGPGQTPKPGEPPGPGSTPMPGATPPAHPTPRPGATPPSTATPADPGNDDTQ
jgi:hypothetical protein